MRDAVDLAPAVGIRLARVLEELCQARREDLGTAARHRLESRGLQARERVFRLDLPASPEVVDLGGSERLDLNGRVRLVDRLDHPLVVLERPLVMVTPDDGHLAGLV